MWWRLVLLLFVAAQARGPLREIGWGLFGGITFGAHEFGHLFFALFGNEFLTVAGGSLMQLLVPIGAGALMWRSRDGVGIAIAGLWLAAAIGDLSWYVGDARALELPLVSMGGEGDDHDWNYLLRTFDLLRSDLVIAAQLRRMGTLIWFGSLAGGLVACWRLWQGRRMAEAPSA